MTAGISIVYFYDLASGKATQVNLDWPNGLGYDLQTVPGGFIALLAAGSHDEPAFYAKDGASWKRTQLSGDHVKNFQSFNVSDDGKTIVYEYSTASLMPQLYRAELSDNKLASPAQVTKLNENLVKNREYAKTEVIRWKGSNDEMVEGILYYPTHYEEGKKYPLITAIHGGPQGSDKDLWGESWAYPLQLFTQAGSFVLRPNYHGSNNYGLKWSESICCGKYYDLETPDINAGVDYMISKGSVDADKIATMGWSNGSILSTSLITTYPERYKVASVGAGDIEWISDWGNVAFGEAFDAYYFGKVADAGSAALHQQIAVFQDGQGESAGADFPRLGGHQRSSCAELVVFPRAAILRTGAGEVHCVPRRAARAAQIDASDAQGG